MYGCSRDITERKGLEAERLLLEQSRQQIEKSESLNRMAGAVAHHFNNMLAAVLGNLEMAQMDLPPGMEVAQHIVDAKRATLRAAEMSRLMLTYTGHSQRTARVLDLSETCNRMATLLEKIKPGRVRLLIDCPSPGPLVNADEGQIQQVLTHLVTNAWEAAGDKEGEVRVAVHTSAAPAIPRASGRPAGWKPTAGFYAELQVADTGCGIPSKDISRLMDPFFSTKFTGRGLGLAVVLGIVQAHGGAIQVRSKEGVGSTFEVFLPLADQQRAAGEGVANAAPAASGAKGQVLLVEDEDTVRKVAEVMLRRLGLQVLTAVDGAEAVQIFRENQDRIALVLSDLTMPRMNGWETLNALRHLQPDIPVILASGYDEARVMAGDHAEKPQAFLQKPYEMKTLKETLEKVFGKRIAFGLA
jgi:nitrogen-specific signal transduction histidine kinase/CheY-like chemotaxis protein